MIAHKLFSFDFMHLLLSKEYGLLGLTYLNLFTGITLARLVERSYENKLGHIVHMHLYETCYSLYMKIV
jgi:hypothetical protein